MGVQKVVGSRCFDVVGYTRIEEGVRCLEVV